MGSDGMMYVPGFMKTGSGVEAILRFSSASWKIGMLVFLTGEICEMRCWNRLRWHDKHTKLHDDWFRHWSDIKINIATIWEAVILILLIEGIYEVRRWDGFMPHDKRYRRSSNIKAWPQIWKALMLVLLLEEIYAYAIEIKLRCHNTRIRTKFHKFRHPTFDRGNTLKTQRYTDSKVIS
jgi:hypothetical protein